MLWSPEVIAILPCNACFSDSCEGSASQVDQSGGRGRSGDHNQKRGAGRPNDAGTAGAADRSAGCLAGADPLEAGLGRADDGRRVPGRVKVGYLLDPNVVLLAGGVTIKSVEAAIR